MENIFIKETDTTPEISFNYQRGLLEIKGVSIPEDTEDFYEYLLNYLNLYIQEPQNMTTTVSFKLIYINTSTSAIMARIIKVLEKLHGPKHSVTARWYYEEGDEDMKEIGSDFRAFTALPFVLIPCEEIV